MAASRLSSTLAEARPRRARSYWRGCNLSQGFAACRYCCRARRRPPLAVASALVTLGRLPDGEFVAARIDEMEAAAAGEGEDRLGNHAPGLGHRIESGIEILDPDDRQRRRNSVRRVTLQANIDIARHGRRIIRPEIGEGPTKCLCIESTGQFMRRCARQLDIIDAGHDAQYRRMRPARRPWMRTL